MLLKEFNLAGGHIVHGSNHTDLAIGKHLIKHCTLIPDVVQGQLHVFDCNTVYEVRVFGISFFVLSSSCGIHSRGDPSEQAGQVAELCFITSPFNGATGGVAHHYDETCSGQLAGKLHASEDVFVYEVSGDAGVKYIPYTLVENDLCGYA